ncbi:MAG: hypothetical protein Q7V56_05090 [Gammaproteobacteria bacterium]|nr:hypothetical protein [Gammaproteobacteria bacterium]
MKFVGEKLALLAKLEKDDSNRNLLGRSAYNRFYYASFLVTREMLATLDPSWKTTAHSRIPELLSVTVTKEVKKVLKASARKGIISEAEEKSWFSRLSTACSELSKLLKIAYEIRVVADYTPENLIVFDRGVISLDGCKLPTANEWYSQASAYCKVIQKVWKDSGLAHSN